MARPFYIDVIDALNEAAVRYTVVGGVATILHGAPRMTGDLDLAVILEKENLLSLIESWKTWGIIPRFR